jgi:HAE1 family hydrophobic/amphiphilic exporter-1
MTSFAFILGVVPLALSTGAGAHGRVLLGIAVIGGMLAASVIAIFLIPVSFYLVEKLVHRPKQPGRPTPGTPKHGGDGEAHLTTPSPKSVPAHARFEGGH